MDKQPSKSCKQGGSFIIIRTIRSLTLSLLLLLNNVFDFYYNQDKEKAYSSKKRTASHHGKEKTSMDRGRKKSNKPTPNDGLKRPKTRTEESNPAEYRNGLRHDSRSANLEKRLSRCFAPR